MQQIYEHRQVGRAMMAIIVIPVIGFVAAISLAVWAAPSQLLPPVVILLGFMLLTMLMFGSLTVKVDTQRVLIAFGLNLVRRSFPLRQISAARVVRNTPLMGLGIHFIPGGLIYNVSGLDAVEITLEGGRRARIGTDEPAELVRAIEEAKRLSAIHSPGEAG